MSYVRLNISDKTQTIHDDVHGHFGDALIAALTAEPETVEELGAALARFIKPVSDGSPFARFKQGMDLEPYDAGVVVIDLAARVVACDSSYSQPSADGSLHVQSDFAEEEVYVPYRSSGDWMFVYSIPEYEGVCASRREERLAVEPLDAREVLYGRPLLEFIARECSEARGSDDEALFTKIHAKWLMTARDDLCGRTPREVLLEKQDFIDFDLHSRSVQWSFTKECPPPLPPDSNAYRFAGFGTYEIVLYYELIRYLLGECFARVGDSTSIDAVVERLERLAKEWLDAPDEESYGRTPAQIIESERRRVNLIVSTREAIIDEDCEVCQALAADFDTPMFWHLDGCNMDAGFEFSFYKTLGEFEEEARRREEFNREFERDWKAGKYEKPLGEPPTGFDDDDGTPF